MNKKRAYNIFVLGAGFSAPANIPLAQNLWELILDKSLEVISRNGSNYTMYENILQPDIVDYITYHNSSKPNLKRIISDTEINIEDFISYLDIEEYLHLLGSKHWSDAGSKSQTLIRNFIADIIYSAQLRITDEQKTLYDQFVRKLEPNDLIITFNYDTILEDSFERNNIPYRYYYAKYQEIKPDGVGIFDSDSKDIILHKMHGSIDWISNKYFVSKGKMCIWNQHRSLFNARRILSEPYYENNEMKTIYRITNLGKYFKMNQKVLESPLIISPSYNKMVYLNPLKELWNGFIGNGRGSKRLIFIGFSLPPHDEYIRQPLYYLVKNFEYAAKEEGNRTSVIDYKTSTQDQDKFKENYGFLDRRIADFYFDGFNIETLDKIFRN